MHHAWPRGASSVRDRGAIEYNWLPCSRPPGSGLRHGALLGNAELDRLHAVIKRQVDQILTSTCGNVLDEFYTVERILGRPAYREPTPYTLFSLHIEIKAAHPRRWHMRQSKCFGSQRPAGLNHRCVSDESHRHSGGITTQLPNRVSHDTLGLRRQSVIKCFSLCPTTPFHIELPDIEPAGLLVGIELSEFLIQDLICDDEAGEKEKQHSRD